MNKAHLSSIAAAGLVLLALAGCSDVKDTAAPKPTGSPSAFETLHALPKKVVNCEDGSAKVDVDSKNVTIDGDCKTVTVTASNSMVTVAGTVEALSVTGTVNAITAKEIKTVEITTGSNANQITTENTPKVHDKGEMNKINAK